MQISNLSIKGMKNDENKSYLESSKIELGKFQEEIFICLSDKKMSSAKQIAFFQRMKRRGNGCRRIYLLTTNRDEGLNFRVF